jgi:hypothetical protein
MTNLINCGTCGYPLTPEERTSLIERDGVMVKPAPVQPVAWMPLLTPFNTTPPGGRQSEDCLTAAQRQSARSAWVGLETNEVAECWHNDPYKFYRAVEAKLKAKNFA